MVELEAGDGEAELVEGVLAEVGQAGVGDAQRDALLGREPAGDGVAHLRERRHALARHLQRAVALPARAGRDLAPHGAVQRRADRQAEQRVQERRHDRGGPQHRTAALSGSGDRLPPPTPSPPPSLDDAPWGQSPPRFPRPFRRGALTDA